MRTKSKNPLKFVFFRFPKLYYGSTPIGRKELIKYLSTFYTLTNKEELIKKLKELFEEIINQKFIPTKGTISKNTDSVYFAIPVDKLDYYEKEIKPILELDFVKKLLAFYVFKSKEITSSQAEKQDDTINENVEAIENNGKTDKTKYYRNIIYVPYDMPIEEALSRYNMLFKIDIPEADDDFQKIVEYFIFNTYPFRACFKEKMKFNSFEEKLRKFYFVLHYLKEYEKKKSFHLLKPLAFVTIKEGDKVKHFRMDPEEYRKYILDRAKEQPNFNIMRKVFRFLNEKEIEDETI